MNGDDPEAGQGPPRPWLLLIHHLPPEPAYLRVKVSRRLHGLGATQLKPTVYALPDYEEALEDFHWLAREIEADGGSAMLCRAEFLAGITDAELAARTGGPVSPSPPPRSTAPEAVAPGRRWVTRTGVKVDRMASAWLIRRWIDPAASFAFVPAGGYTPAAGELRFDMYEGEYGHEGGACTFEVLARRFGIHDAAVTAIGEIVHDLDCKDARYGRIEAAGVGRLVGGIVASTDADAERLAKGAALFDALHAAFSGPGVS